VVDLSELQRVHIIGIGGAGMSAIARVLHGRGIQVTGSDRDASPMTDALRDEGVAVTIGHSADTLDAVDLVLASSAIPDDNVELKTARERSIPVQRRPEFLPVLTAGYEVIAVAGAHGKTTVTGMLALTLFEAGLDPTFIVGGVMANLHTNARCGTSSYFVIEADEYRNTYHGLKPSMAVVTNIEYDHPDFFPSMRHLRWSFGEFVNNIRQDGLLIACHDDEIVHAMAASYHANGGRVILYGQFNGAALGWQAQNCRGNGQGGVSFDVIHEGENLGEAALQIPGDFNAINALAVMAVSSELGIPWEIVRQALAHYKGIARRFEILGEVQAITVVDDYAHHPTQIIGVLKAARQRFPGRRLIAAWEPHTFSRVKALYTDFMQAFGNADKVVILPIYAAREIDDGTMTTSDLAEHMQHTAVKAVNSLEDAVTSLLAVVAPGDVVLLMGAGHEYVVGKRLLEKLGTVNRL
jgi:UDP-N-acetylmuramate--alanine ligase